jgi:hypothetical protein
MIMKYLNQTLFQPRIPVSSRIFDCTKSNRTNYNYINNRTRFLCTKKEPIPFDDLFFHLPPLLGEEFLCTDAACIKLIFGEPLPNIIVALSIQIKGK